MHFILLVCDFYARTVEFTLSCTVSNNTIDKEFHIFQGYLNMCCANRRPDNGLVISRCNQVIGCRVCIPLISYSPALTMPLI